MNAYGGAEALYFHSFLTPVPDEGENRRFYALETARTSPENGKISRIERKWNLRSFRSVPGHSESYSIIVRYFGLCLRANWGVQEDG